MKGKGHNQTLGKSGKRYPKGFPYPVSACGSPAGATLEPLRRRRIDYREHNGNL